MILSLSCDSVTMMNRFLCNAHEDYATVHDLDYVTKIDRKIHIKCYTGAINRSNIQQRRVKEC